MTRRLLPLVVLLALPASAEAKGALDRPFDVRRSFGQSAVRAPVSAVANHARVRLKRALGAEGILKIDPLTGTPRVIARLDGFLSAPAAGTAEQIALGWARGHKAVLGLRAADFAGLKLLRAATGPDGVTAIVWAQTHRGVPSLDTTLRAAVDRRGRLVWIGGSPLPGLKADTMPALCADPRSWTLFMSRANALGRR